MERKIEVTLERKDYIALFMLLMNKKLMLIAAIPLIIAIPAGAFLLSYVGSRSGLSLWALMLPYAALVSIFVLIFLRALIAPAIRQFKEAQKEFGNKFTFALSSDGFICHGGPASAGGKLAQDGGDNHGNSPERGEGNTLRAEYSYARLDRALENKNYIFFFVNGGQACVFPKRQMHDLDLAFLKKILPKCASIGPSELAGAFRADAGDSPDEPLS